MSHGSQDTFFKADQDLPHVSARIFSFGLEFLQPFLKPFGNFVDRPEDADLILSMNSTETDAVRKLADAQRWNKPIAWWTVEDPNWFDSFLPQAKQADYVFTTDAACIPRYSSYLGHQCVFWLPLAASPQFHQPFDVATDATDLVISANWYQNQARMWGVSTVVDPLIDAGYSLTLFCYTSFMWPAPYHRFWRGETHYRTTAEQYRHGRVVLGLNNQRSGMDGRGKSFMTSMRTFEALACGKPFLSAHSDAYERLGFVNGEHMVWVDCPADAQVWAQRLLNTEGEHIAQSGREFVLGHHTYGHRLARIAEVALG